MWRAFFLAMGITLALLGGQGLVVERAIMRSEQPGAVNNGYAAAPGPRQEFLTPEWAPWSFLSAGAVVIIYSLTLARHPAAS